MKISPGLIFISDGTFTSKILLEKIKSLNNKEFQKIVASEESIELLHLIGINETPSFGVVTGSKFIPIAEGNISISKIRTKLNSIENMVKK